MAQNEYDDQEQSPEQVAVEEARRQLDEDPETMKAEILRHSRESTSIEHGLTEEKPVDDEPDPELVELGRKRYEERKAQQAAEPPPLSDEARELLEEATTLELEGGYETEKGVRYAERDREGFLDLVRQMVEDDPGIEEVLERFGAVDLGDLQSSDAFVQLTAEEQEEVLAEIADNPAVAYADEVLSQRRAEDLAEKQGKLGQAYKQAEAAESELWGARVSAGLGGAGLSEIGWDGVRGEIEGMQDGLRSGGAAIMEKLVEGFDSANPVHLGLLEDLTTPLDARAGNDPDLAPTAQVLGHLVTELAREMAGQREGRRILEAAGNTLPMVDHERQEYVENWGVLPSKPVTSIDRLKELVRGGVPANRTGKQLGRDLRRENLSIRSELESARNQHDKGYGKELARRHAGQR